MNNKPVCWNKLVATGILSAVALSVLTQTLETAAAKSKFPSVIIGKENIVKLEVASTKQEIERGLMYRTSLPEDQGMVFLYHPAQPVEFWMFHTLIPLDMLFVKDGKIVKICAGVPPAGTENPSECARYGPGRKVDISEVIELAGGYAKRHKISEGDPVKFELP